jgi:hypothetical protein
LGNRLYGAVFSGDVRDCWRSSLSEAEARNAGLRLRLRIADAPELNDIPWEYLYNASLNRFLSLSDHTPLIRYLDLPERVRPLAVDGRLEILIMISSPTDYPGLDVESEWSRLSTALARLVESGQIGLKRLAEASLSVLQRELRSGQYHVLHFIGHGGFDRESQDGVLVLCDEAGRGRLVAAEHLGTILHDHRSLRLVVLNACEGSRSSRTDSFSGVAQTLVQQGVPAVIAMQFEITDGPLSFLPRSSMPPQRTAIPSTPHWSKLARQSLRRAMTSSGEPQSSICGHPTGSSSRSIATPLIPLRKRSRTPSRPPLLSLCSPLGR